MDILRRFIDWSKLKFKIHTQNDIGFYFHEREIWWTSIGQNVGSEENGKNINFERPVLVLKKFNRNTFLGIPASSKLRTDRYHYIFSDGQKQYCLILSQIRILSSKRLLRHIGRITVADFENIKAKFRQLL